MSRRSEQAIPNVRFETLFEQAPFSIQLLGKDGRTLRVNRAWKRLWQRDDGSELLDYVLNHYNVLQDPDLESKGITAYLRRAFAGEEVELPETFLDHAALDVRAQPRWIRARASPVFGDDGEVVEVMLIHEDISAQKAADLTGRLSERRMEQLANSIPQLAWMADSTGSITWYNDRWYEYTGTTAEQMTGWGWQSVHDPEALPAVMKLWTASLVSGEPFQMTFPLKGKDGAFRPFFTLVAPLKDATGAVQQWFGTNTDVSELKSAEDALRALAAELAATNLRKTEFLATLAHELRNPLAPLRNGLQILRLGSGDTAVAGRARDMMERQVDHLVRLVDDLLDVARISGGKIELRRETASLQEVVARAVETAMPAIEAQRHILTVDAPEEPVLVDIDPARFTQILANLLGNAAKYTPPGGQLRVVAGVERDLAVAKVVDNGVGIPAAALEHVFDMFAQVRDNMSMAQGGLGIGLSLAKKLVDLHGGSLSAASEGPGEGSTFTVCIPLATLGAETDEDPKESVGTSAAAQSLRVLVVDDNLDAGDSLALLLSFEKHQVRVARDGATGLKIAREFQPHVAFLDIGMPGMNGYEVAAAIRGAGGLQPLLVALTGWGSKADVERTLAAGFDKHLTKPANAEDIKLLLASVVNASGRSDLSRIPAAGTGDGNFASTR